MLKYELNYELYNINNNEFISDTIFSNDLEELIIEYQDIIKKDTCINAEIIQRSIYGGIEQDSKTLYEYNNQNKL